MGEKLMRYYDHVSEEEGLMGKMELAKKTKLPSTKAATAPDTEENVRKFRSAIEEITEETPPEL